MGLRVDGKPFTLDGREYIVDVIRDTSPDIVIPKAAQMAFTVTFITRSLHWITQRGWNHLYLLPLKAGAIPFVQARIDPIIDNSEELQHEFQSVDNRLHKQTQTGVNLYIRGTNILNELQEVPVDVEVWDERDRMVEDNLEEARARMDGSKVKRLTMLSTPTVPGHGVDAEDAWHISDQHRWEVACIGCGRYQVLNFDHPSLDYNNLRLGDKPEEAVLECAFCYRQIQDHERPVMNATGRWTAFNPGGATRGYHISQFNSPVQSLVEIVKPWHAGQTNARKMRSFFNQKLGMPFVAAGDQLTPEIIDKARTPGYTIGGIPNSLLYVGIDIGAVIHVWVTHKGAKGECMLWDLKIFNEWGQVDRYLESLTSWVGVVDAHPEKRAARDLAIKHHGRLWIGFSSDRDQNDDIVTWQKLRPGEPGKATIDRNLALDTLAHQYFTGKMILPNDARELGEHMPRRDYNGFYYQQIQMVRVEEEKPDGGTVARWKKNRNADHWHHAGMFSMVAMQRTGILDVPASISNMFRKASIIGG